MLILEMKNGCDHIVMNIFVVCRPVSPSTRVSVSPIRPVKSPSLTRKQVRTRSEAVKESTLTKTTDLRTSAPGLSDHTNHHHHAVLLLQVSGSAEVLPPWKQGDYMAEASYTTMSSMTSVSSATQLHMEKHWEQQVTATREVRMETIV